MCEVFACLLSGNFLSLQKVWPQIRTDKMLVLIWIQTVRYSDNGPERIFEKVNFEKSQQMTTKA